MILISIALRYPLVEHERHQTDSYFIHHLSDSIDSDGYAKWIFHPLSFFGYYPLSYPSGVPFLIAEFSMLSGLSIEACILVFNLIIASLFCLAAFLLTKQFLSRMDTTLLAVVLAILGSRFVDTSYWDGSARTPLVAIMVLLLAVVFRTSSPKEWKRLGVFLPLGIGCFALHHMAVLLLLFSIAYILTIIGTEYVRTLWPTQRRNAVGIYSLIALALIVLVAYVFFDFFGAMALRNLQTTPVLDIEPVFLSVFLNMAASYTSQIGFVLVFAVASIPLVIRRSPLMVADLYPVFVLVAFVPLLGNSLYTSMILSPFVAMLGAIWFARVLDRRKAKRLIRVVLVLLLAASIALPVLSTNRWNTHAMLSGDTVAVGNQDFNDINYALHFDECYYAVANVNSLRLRMEAVSRVPFLGSGILLALNDEVRQADVNANVSLSSSIFPENLYKWFVYEQEPPVDLHVRRLMIEGLCALNMYPEASKYFAGHPKFVVMIDNRWSSEYVTSYSAFQAEFPGELMSSSPSTCHLNTELHQEFSSYLYYRSASVSMFLTQIF